MQRFRLTKAAKILIMIIVVVLIGSGIFAGVKTGIVKTSKDKTKTDVVNDISKNTENSDPDMVLTKDTTGDDATINLSLDEWVGWKEIIDSNGGLTTQPGSIYDQLGIKVNINVINDATQSSNALIKGDLNAAGYTINRLAFLSSKFTDAGINVVMPYITNYSNGGDGIIAKNSIQSINDLVDAKIGVPQFSEAQTLVVWFVNQSDLSQEDKDKIISNLILFETPDETAKAFFAGQVDVAATWQPYLSQAEDSTDSHILFSTASSTSLVMDGITFREDFAKAHPDVVQKFIDGALQASELYTTEFDPIKNTMPMFSTETDESIVGMTGDAKLTTWNNNIEILNGTAVSMYNDMCDVWTSIGESVNKDMVYTVFDDSYMEALADKYESVVAPVEETKVVVTEDNKQDILDTTALLSKSATVNFVINTAKFTDSTDASAKLDEFIKIAQQLDGTIIEIAGNTDPNPNSDPTDEANKLLSQQRAEAVKKYFVLAGVDANRIITVGNGSSNPIVGNDTEEHRAMNRRTDVSFKCIEQ